VPKLRLKQLAQDGATDGQVATYSTATGEWEPSTVGAAAIATGNELWVDAVNGNDGTAVAGRFDLPWMTVGAALTAATSGDSVIVRPGAYVESGLTVPTGVSLIGEGSWQTTTIGDFAAVGTVLTLSDDSMIRGLRLRVPSTGGVAACVYSGVGGTLTASIYDVQLVGDGGAGSGTGISKSGAGKIIGAEIRFDAGGIGIGLVASSGAIALEGIHVPPAAGTFSTVARVEGTGRLQLADFNVGNANVVDVCEVAGGTLLVYGANFFNALNMVHIEADGVFVGLYGGKMDHGTGGFDFLVDPALTGAGTVVQATTAHEADYSFPPAALATDFELSFFQESSEIETAAFRIFGPEAVFGFPEQGTFFQTGRGRSYVKGIAVLTTDNTAGPGSDGANFVDVTADAQTLTGSTFTFQGTPATSAGATIAFTTQRVDVGSVALPFWGIQLLQSVAGVGGEYVIEVRTAANTWVEVGVQAVAVDTDFRYGADLFLRASSTEDLRFGVFGAASDPLLPNGTAWPATTMNAITGRWARVRVTSAVTTLPTFQRLAITPSHCEFNAEGERVAHGLALWRLTVSAGGNIFGESGGVVNASIPIGSGGLPTGWNQIAPNAKLNQNGDAIYFQFAIQDGICTAYPVSISVVYSLEGSQPVTAAPQGIVSVLPVQVASAKVADPAGGLTPIRRTIANTELLTAKAAQTDTQNLIGGATLPDTLDNRAMEATFGPFGVSGYYEDDLVFVRFELDNDGTPNQDVTVWALIISAVAFSEGAPI